MVNERILRKAEKEVLAGIMAIKNGTKTPAEANLGRILNSLKNLDEPLYDELMEKYKKAVELSKIFKPGNSGIIQQVEWYSRKVLIRVRTPVSDSNFLSFNRNKKRKVNQTESILKIINEYKDSTNYIQAEHEINGEKVFRIENYQNDKPYWFDGPDSNTFRLIENDKILESLYHNELKRRERKRKLEQLG